MQKYKVVNFIEEGQQLYKIKSQHEKKMFFLAHFKLKDHQQQGRNNPQVKESNCSIEIYCYEIGLLFQQLFQNMPKELFQPNFKQFSHEIINIILNKKVESIPYTTMYYLSLFHFTKSTDDFNQKMLQNYKFSRRGEVFMAELHLFIMRFINLSHLVEINKLIKSAMTHMLK